MKKSLFSIVVVALLAAVAVLAPVSSTITVQADQKSADEKADSQAAKGHTDQADNACQKAGYDGYIISDCGFLN
jgi:hypothetical protein